MTPSTPSAEKDDKAAEHAQAEQEKAAQKAAEEQQAAADKLAKDSATKVALAWRAEQQRKEIEEEGYEELLKDYDAEQKKAEKADKA